MPHKSLHNYYTVLNLTPGASLKAIKQQYHKLALRYHPDKSGGDTNEKFKSIVEAYEALTFFTSSSTPFWSSLDNSLPPPPVLRELDPNQLNPLQRRMLQDAIKWNHSCSRPIIYYSPCRFLRDNWDKLGEEDIKAYLDLLMAALEGGSLSPSQKAANQEALQLTGPYYREFVLSMREFETLCFFDRNHPLKFALFRAICSRYHPTLSYSNCLWRLAVKGYLTYATIKQLTTSQLALFNHKPLTNFITSHFRGSELTPNEAFEAILNFHLYDPHLHNWSDLEKRWLAALVVYKKVPEKFDHGSFPYSSEKYDAYCWELLHKTVAKCIRSMDSDWQTITSSLFIPPKFFDHHIIQPIEACITLLNSEPFIKLNKLILQPLRAEIDRFSRLQASSQSLQTRDLALQKKGKLEEAIQALEECIQNDLLTVVAEFMEKMFAVRGDNWRQEMCDIIQDYFIYKAKMSENNGEARYINFMLQKIIPHQEVEYYHSNSQLFPDLKRFDIGELYQRLSKVLFTTDSDFGKHLKSILTKYASDPIVGLHRNKVGSIFKFLLGVLGILLTGFTCLAYKPYRDKYIQFFFFPHSKAVLKTMNEELQCKALTSEPMQPWD